MVYIASVLIFSDAVFVDEEGGQYEGAPVKGSYSALNCYYLTLIDEAFAKQQHEKLKALFWKDGFVTGLKEYWDRACPIGLDMDAGPIILELSPSGTAFFAGSATFYNDTVIRKGILKTAEIAGHTIKMGNKKHYLLANVALVGESIMLAMRTHFNVDKRYIYPFVQQRNKSTELGSLESRQEKVGRTSK